MIAQLRHIRKRRAFLSQAIDVKGEFKRWEESCVPSYCHANPFAAYVSWMRLFAAANLARATATRLNHVLDFGASVGELRFLLEGDRYDFIEENETAAAFLLSQAPEATRQTLEGETGDTYDAVFAIDSLEHNVNYADLVPQLITLLAPTGVLIISGPTENALYKLGRKVAGFDAHYHVTTIYDIETVAAEQLEMTGLKVVPFGVPLFRLSAWRRR